MERDGKENIETYDQVLVSVGRRPNTDKMGVNTTGIKVDKQGFISVDKYQKNKCR